MRVLLISVAIFGLLQLWAVFVTTGSACVLPDSDGVPRSAPDVPATVQSGWILKGPTGARDDAAGRSQELRHITTGCERGTGSLKHPPLIP